MKIFLARFATAIALLSVCLFSHTIILTRLIRLRWLKQLQGRITNIPGWHIAGDGALEVLFQTYRAHMSDERIRDLRIAGDHCFGVRPDQIEMTARLGHTFSCNYDTENTIIIEEDYGDEYLAWNLPVASMLKAGVDTLSVHLAVMVVLEPLHLKTAQTG